MSRRISSFFSDIGRLFLPSRLTERALQIHLERNPQQALHHWTKIILHQWAEEGGSLEQRDLAKRAIKAFLSDPNRGGLSLSRVYLSTLPDIWEHPAFIERLINLHLSQNQLETFPESIVQLTALKCLRLNHNQISVIPESISQLRTLKVLDLHRNRLLTVPESIGQLTALRELYISRNRLQSIPESIGRLTALTHLYLSNNRFLTGLPQEIFALPSSCKIYLESCGLSTQVLGRLREQCNAIGYHGPRIFYSMENIEARTIDTRTVDELLDVLYQIACKTRIPFPEEFTSSLDLRDWLSRIFYMADFKTNQGEKRAAVAQKVLNLLELATNPNHREFHDVFLGTIANARRSCGDSMSLSLLHLGIARKLSLVDPRDLQGLATLLLRGSWTLSQLEEFARNKVRSLPIVDEIEVYLGYPIMLKERLAIPIDVDEMLYFRCSQLTESDLQLAEDVIRANLQDEDKLCRFLSSNDTWIKALDTLGLLEELKANRVAKEEKSSSFEEDETIQAEFKNKLAGITKEQVLSFYKKGF